MNWIKDFKHSITTVEGLKKHINLTAEESQRLEKVAELYPMSIPEYYLSLIDPNDPKDPIRKMAIPSTEEMILDGDFDTSGEASNTVSVGLQHKYQQTALVLSTNLCAMYCRHCFRKRLVGLSDEETVTLFDEAAEYIASHPEIDNVLISGGDAFLNSNAVITHYLKTLAPMEHLNFIRFGSRLPVVLPNRIYEDKELLSILKEYNKKKRIYVVTQFNHPRELTAQAKKAIEALMDQGIVVGNQAVLLKGVNDNVDTLTQLLNGLTSWGVVTNYVFQCRPVTSVKNQFQVPLEEGYRIIEDAKSRFNGHTKRFRYCMSHPTGKIEILGPMDDGQMVFKYNQAKSAEDNGRLFTKKLEENQSWLEEI